MLFTINSHDYSEKIQKDTYKISQNDVGYRWKDGNHKTHLQEVLKVQGSFDIAFVTVADYNTFLNDITTATDNDGYVACTLFVNNLNNTDTIDAIITLTPSKHRPVDSTVAVNIISVGIEEA